MNKDPQETVLLHVESLLGSTDSGEGFLELRELCGGVLEKVAAENEVVAACLDPSSLVENRDEKLRDLAFVLKDTILRSKPRTSFSDDVGSGESSKWEEEDEELFIVVEKCSLCVALLMRRGFDVLFEKLNKWKMSDAELGELRVHIVGFRKRNHHLLKEAEDALLQFMTCIGLLEIFDEIVSDGNASRVQVASDLMKRISSRDESLLAAVRGTIVALFGAGVRAKEINYLWHAPAFPANVFVQKLAQFADVELPSFQGEENLATKNLYAPEDDVHGGIDLGNGMDRIVVPHQEWRRLFGSKNGEPEEAFSNKDIQQFLARSD